MCAVMYRREASAKRKLVVVWVVPVVVSEDKDLKISAYFWSKGFYWSNAKNEVGVDSKNELEKRWILKTK